MPLKAFGEFNFNQPQIILQDADLDFSHAETALVPLLGAVGAYDAYGDEQPPDTAGKIIQKLVVVGTPATMEGYRDAFKRLRHQGYQRLVYRPADGRPERWCDAKLIDIDMPRIEAGIWAELHQPVTLVWSVPYPRWLTDHNESAAIWGEAEWETAEWEDPATAEVTVLLNASNPKLDLTIVNQGTELAYPRFVFRTTSGIIFYPTIQRLVDGVVVDEISFTNFAIIQNQWLEINCRDQTLTGVIGTTYYPPYKFFNPPLHGGWIRLAPGSNTIRIISPSANGKVAVYFYEEYS